MVNRSCALALLGALAACSDGAPAHEAGDGSAPDAALADAGVALCRPTPDCKPVDTLFLALAPCCSATIACGYELLRPEQLRGVFADPMAVPTPDNPNNLCVAVTSLFRAPKDPEEKRVEVPGGEPIFYTPACGSQAILAYTFYGCCMATGECGLATDVALNALRVLAAPFPSPLSRAECTSAAQLNAALSASSAFAGLAHFQQTPARCDYAGLVGRLPPAPAPEP